MDINQLLSKIPRPVLIVSVLGLALIFIVFQNPLKDECDIKTTLFLNSLRGITGSTTIKGKTQFAQLGFWRDRCREGNSIGACEDYFNGLRTISTSLKVLPEQCLPNFSENNEWLLKVIVQAIQSLAVIAWGEKPPASVSERAGWLTEANLQSFCILKKVYTDLVGAEGMAALKNNTYEQYPDVWADTVTLDLRTAENRPKALKSEINISGTLDKNQIYQRSLFSVRCDLYQ